MSKANVDFLIVGACALAAHGHRRATGDIDIWGRPTQENAQRVWIALEDFGAPTSQLHVEDLTTPEIVFQIGNSPRRIDILTSISGLKFDDAWPNKVSVEIDGLELPILGRNDLISNKRATGRPEDQPEADALESQRTAPESE